MEPLLDARKQLIVEDALHLEWHTRHEGEDDALLLQPHAGCRAIGVGDISASLRQHSLTAVALTHLETTTLEKRDDVVVSFLAKLQLRVKELADRRLGDVVGRGAKSSCHQHQVGIHAGIEGIEDGFFGITDGQGGVQTESGTGKLFTQPCGIGVNHLTDKQFITDGDILYNDFFHHDSIWCKDRPFFDL